MEFSTNRGGASIEQFFTPSSSSCKRPENFFYGRGETVPVLLAADDLFARDPVELNHPPLARKRFVAMPRIVTALECQKGPIDWRNFKQYVFDIFRPQQAQTPPGFFPPRIQIKE